MTAETPDASPNGTVEQAMNRVLEAEREAQQAVAACEHDALQHRQDAQQQAKQIARRTDARLALCHTRSKGRLDRDIRELERAAASTDAAAGDRLDAAALASVVEAVARVLAGVTPDENRSGDR